MKQVVIISTLFMAAIPAQAQIVEVGKGQWSDVPKLHAKWTLPNSDMVGRLEKILQTKQCSFPGQSHRRFDITVSYGMLREPDGKVSRIFINETGCQPLEKMVAKAALTLVEKGGLGPMPENHAQWYASSINFTQR